MKQARLIICPKSVAHVPEQSSEIILALKDIGLITTEYEPNTYYAGTNFLSLISFLGCSPNIQLNPDEGDNFCYINLSDISPNSQLLGYCQSISPKCPVCKARIKDWKDTANWKFADTLYTCKQCNTESTLADLKWRQEGGYGRFHLSIVNIHPHEAVPAECVFQTLSQLTGFEWTYFYANNESES